MHQGGIYTTGCKTLLQYKGIYWEENKIRQPERGDDEAADQTRRHVAAKSKNERQQNEMRTRLGSRDLERTEKSQQNTLL